MTAQANEPNLRDLIQQAGKLHLLSHRAVMFAQLASADGAAALEHRRNFKAALSEYEEIAAQISPQGAEARQSADLKSALRTDAEAVADLAAMRRFVEAASALDTTAKDQRRKRIEDLAAFVAGPLHESLKRVIGRIGGVLDLRGNARDGSDQANRAALVGAVDKIERISFSVRLIALNAAVEAARAGTAGVGFGVIAGEIKSLSESAAEAADEARRQLRTL